jgi:hypothetical protein
MTYRKKMTANSRNPYLTPEESALSERLWRDMAREFGPTNDPEEARKKSDIAMGKTLADLREKFGPGGRGQGETPKGATGGPGGEHALQEAVMSPRKDPAHPLFAHHNCWRCQHGTLDCVVGDPYKCQYPRARND